MVDASTLAAVREIRDTLRTILTPANPLDPAQDAPDRAKPVTATEQPHEDPDPGLDEARPGDLRRHVARKRKRRQQRASRRRNRG